MTAPASEAAANESAVRIVRESLLAVAYRRGAPPPIVVSVKVREFVTADGSEGQVIQGERRTPGQQGETLTVPFDTREQAREWFREQTGSGWWGIHAAGLEGINAT